MYYQILVETVDGLGKSKREKKIYEIDKTNKDEIIKDILVPDMEFREKIDEDLQSLVYHTGLA